jgi:hypothetical protein
VLQGLQEQPVKLGKPVKLEIQVMLGNLHPV